jgi:CRP-like cAMP-binding protein
MTVLLSLFRRLSRSESLTTYCDHFFSHSVILRTLFDLNSPQLASFFYNVLITCGCTAYFFIAESHQRSSLTGTDASFNQVVMFLFLAMSVRWSGTTVMDLSQIGLGSQLLMFCVLGLIEVPFDKCDRGSTTLSSYLRRFTLGANALYVAVPLGWIILCQIGSMNSFNSFNCMFEVMSAFFNSGVTIANQDNPDLASLSYIGSLPNASKMILLLVMLAGRFRKVSALPQACKEAIQSWKASPDSVLDMRKLNSGVGSVAFAQSEGHLEPAIAELLKLIDNVPAIKSLSSSQRIQLCRVLTTRSFSDEECIIRQGDVGDSAFIIISGSVSIRKSIGPGDPEIPLVVLQKGAFFGELALMHNAPRGASAYSEGISDCIVVSKSAFDSIRDAVSSELKERELGYVRSEVEALTLKIKRLEAELLALRRRKSSHEFCLPTTLSSDNVMLTTRGTPVIPSDALEVSSNSEPFPENLPLPGAATVDIQSSPIPFRQLERTSRPVFKSRRTLLPLPSETPRL